MATSMSCPNCGSQLPPGAIACARCGHQLSAVSPPETEMSPAPTPAADPPAASPAAAAPVSINIDFAAIRSRLGLQQSLPLTAAIVLLIAGFAIATYAHIKYLTADSTDINGQLDAQALFQLAVGCVVATLALCILLRRQAGPLPRADAGNPDLRIALAIGGLASAFTFLGLVFGMDERQEAADSWSTYAQVFAFIASSWLTISRPVPARFGSGNGAMPSLVVVAAAVLALVIGAIMGQNDNFDTWIKGLSWEAAGLVVLVLAVGWFLGLEDRRGVVTNG